MSKDFLKKLNEISGTELNKLVKRLPGIAKKEGLQFIQDNFDSEGFETSPGNVQKWPARKKRPGRASRSDAGRALLVKSGNLKRSWEANSRATGSKIHFTSDRVYAARHNQGLAGMPQRQMIGNSEALNKRIERKFEKELNKLMSK